MNRPLFWILSLSLLISVTIAEQDGFWLNTLYLRRPSLPKHKSRNLLRHLVSAQAAVVAEAPKHRPNWTNLLKQPILYIEPWLPKNDGTRKSNK
ncbi:hypothetical protein QR680_015980 [Steinernema hermaphroditum]|uniref:Uncharacterized protein n=1 Tax=Steinernema hermaphroditum TaxID=289476 RepID=A0AA39HAN8_9BILA|nr:hypothetical protein QR680_015980 [Steinernema hermaphroditum]